MLTGKRFELTRPTLALTALGEKRSAVTIPAGTIIKVISGPIDGDRMVDVLWEGRSVAMFTVDVKERGTEIKGRSTKA